MTIEPDAALLWARDFMEREGQDPEGYAWMTRWMAEAFRAGQSHADAGLLAALEPFAEVAAWAERNGHDLVADFDMLLRGPGMQIAGHLHAQSQDFINARAAIAAAKGA